MRERDSAVMGVTLGNEHMAVEAAHFGNGEDADAAEGVGGNRQNLALGDVSLQGSVRIAVETEEGHVAGGNVAFQGAPIWFKGVKILLWI